MVEQVVLEAERPLVRSTERYGLIERAARLARERQVGLLAFAVRQDTLSVALEGDEDAVTAVLVGVRRGTAHRARRDGRAQRLSVADRRPADLLHAVVELHRCPDGDDPLCSPWTSHRDLMQLRQAAFLDGVALGSRVDARAVHEACGGRALPAGWPPGMQGSVPLGVVLRVAAAVMGVLPGDRHSFAVFAHLARGVGHGVPAIAAALALTPRRIRQLLQHAPPLLDTARLHLADPRLLRVP